MSAQTHSWSHKILQIYCEPKSGSSLPPADKIDAIIYSVTQHFDASIIGVDVLENGQAKCTIKYEDYKYASVIIPAITGALEHNNMQTLWVEYTLH